MGRIATAHKEISSTGVNASNDEVISSEVAKYRTYSYQIKWANNSGSGTYKVQGTLKKKPTEAADWTDLTDMDVAIAGATGNERLHLDLSKGDFKNLKLVYTHSAGSHDVEIAISGKWEA